MFDTDNETQLSQEEQFEQLYYGDDEDDLDDDLDEEPEQQVGEQQEEQPWKNEHNAQMAAMRRRQEEEQRISERVNAAYKNAFSGTINPYNGKPIETEADYLEYQQAHDRALREQAGLKEDDFQRMISSHPAVQQAQLYAQQQAQHQQQQKFVADLKTIQDFDPDVKGFEDIINNPNFAQIDDMFKRGYSLADAYKLANMDKMTQRRQAAAKQQVINQTVNKSHLQKTGNNGQGDDISVPADVMEMYRGLNPGASDKDIRDHYRRTMKGMSK